MSTLINSRKSAPLVMATALVALGYCVASAAADTTDVPRVTVRYEDLNVSRSQGAEALYRRIRTAASSVCEKSYPFDDGLDSRILVRKCEHRALRDAVREAAEPLLTALYNTKNGSDPLPRATVLAQAR